jgi:nucleotide-binding universal stress UspA family protein
MFKNILVATDGSDLAGKAVSHGIALAKALNSKVTFVTVTEPWSAVAAGTIGLSLPVEDYDKGATEFATRVLAGARDTARNEGVTAGVMHVKDQFAAEGIQNTAKEQGCDLIVVASHGRKGLSRLILGSETHRLVTESTVPVLVVR